MRVAQCRPLFSWAKKSSVQKSDSFLIAELNFYLEFLLHPRSDSAIDSFQGKGHWAIILSLKSNIELFHPTFFIPGVD